MRSPMGAQSRQFGANATSLSDQHVNAAVEGHGFLAGTLSSVLGDHLTLLVFLRHRG